MPKKSLLTSAQRKLDIQFVRLQNCNIYCELDFDPESKQGDGWSLQELAEFKRVRGQEATAEGDARDAISYKVLYERAVRVLKPREGLTTENITDEDVWLEITGEFEACYTSDVKISDEELSAFVQENVPFHVWPYWREFVQSSCARIGLSPPIPIPSIYHANHPSHPDTVISSTDKESEEE